MEPRFPVSREDLYNLQMELKQVQFSQNNQAERILRLEKRQADDVALKSVWNSPFPGVIGGTPQQGPVQIPHNEIFDDLDEQGEQLLGSLHLGPAEEEPVRRGAASRANSVRFDESALHGSSWGGHNSRHSGDFGPIRPGSGLLMERSSSHKSDGRHSSAGHSVHSHHSVPSGRASSLGLDAAFPVDDDDEGRSAFEVLGPPVSFYVLGSVPSIVRCWLTTDYAHNTLLYADICTGAQKSTIEYSLIQELGLDEEVQRDVDGIHRARLSVYFAEAIVAHHSNRSSSSEGSVPSITVMFEVAGMDLANASALERKAIRIFVGSDALRAHSADIMFSQNTMVLSGDDRERLRVPFVRPEDDAAFRYICTTQLVFGKPKLNANAAPFVLGGIETTQAVIEAAMANGHADKIDENEQQSSAVSSTQSLVMGTMPGEMEKTANPSRVPDQVGRIDDIGRDENDSETGTGKGDSNASDASRRGSSTGIWGSWRQGPASGVEGSQRDNGPLSGYQPAARSGRNMKILKPPKPSTASSARTGASYEPPLPSRPIGEGRRKSQGGVVGETNNATASIAGGNNGSNVVGNPSGISTVGSNGRWETKRSVSSSSELKPQVASRDVKGNGGTLPRSTNPIGGASAFSWMTPPAPSHGRSSRPPTTTVE